MQCSISAMMQQVGCSVARQIAVAIEVWAGWLVQHIEWQWSSRTAGLLVCESWSTAVRQVGQGTTLRLCACQGSEALWPIRDVWV